MNDQDLTFLRQAIRLAVQNVELSCGGPFGAVIVRDGTVIGTGVNLVTSTPDPTAHAEVTAIRDACQKLNTFKLSGCTIYSSCEPCPMCLSAIYWARLDRLVFAAGREEAARVGFDDQFLYEQVPLAPKERTLTTDIALEIESLEPFHAWAKKHDRIDY